jgi:hypothetical protein
LLNREQKWLPEDSTFRPNGEEIYQSGYQRAAAGRRNAGLNTRPGFFVYCFDRFVGVKSRASAEVKSLRISVRNVINSGSV